MLSKNKNAENPYKIRAFGIFSLAPPAGIVRRCRAYRLAALVAASAKTVPRTVFFRILRMLSPCSIPGRCNKKAAAPRSPGKAFVSSGFPMFYLQVFPSDFC
ncbi:MAG: hypothetical protein IJU56_08370 [Clostridia bacterium]|nr:hypothetical protein [Clostridia bacterium]